MPGDGPEPLDTRIRPDAEVDERDPLERDDVINVYGEGHTSATTLSLAVELIDDGERVSGPSISVEDADVEPRTTREGYLLVFDLDESIPIDRPDDPVVVTVDGGDDYLTETRSVIVVDADPAVPPGVEILRPKLPLLEVELTARTP